MADAPTTPKQYFEEKIAKKLQDRPDISKAVNSVYEFNITGDNGGVWTVDLTKEPGAVTVHLAAPLEPGATVPGSLVRSTVQTPPLSPVMLNS